MNFETINYKEQELTNSENTTFLHFRARFFSLFFTGKISFKKIFNFLQLLLSIQSAYLLLSSFISLFLFFGMKFQFLNSKN
jgi:hypothetical protein